MVIRFATWKDVQGICRVIKLIRPYEDFQGVTGGEFGHAVSEFMCHIKPNESPYPEYGTPPHYFMWVAEINDKIVGTAMMHIQRKLSAIRNMSAHLEEVYVDPEYQGQHIGTKLVETAMNQAKSTGCHKIMLTCWERNRKYYTKLGFEPHDIGMRKDL